MLRLETKKAAASDFEFIKAVADSTDVFSVRGDGRLSIYQGGLNVADGGMTIGEDGLTVTSGGCVRCACLRWPPLLTVWRLAQLHCL